MSARRVIGIAVIAAIIALQSGCVTNADGQTSLLGIIPVETDELAVAEAAANEMSKQGGIVGLIGVAAGAAFGIWRRMKEKNAKAALAAATQATATVAEKLAAMNKVECGDALNVIKNVQAQTEGAGGNGC